jgi:tocopherol cyclase
MLTSTVNLNRVDARGPGPLLKRNLAGNRVKSLKPEMFWSRITAFSSNVETIALPRCAACPTAGFVPPCGKLRSRNEWQSICGGRAFHRTCGHRVLQRRSEAMLRAVVPWNGARTLPHAGVHLPSATKGFFEGWYLRIVLPSSSASFAFMYSLEDGRIGRMQVLSAARDELLVSREMMDGFHPALRHLPTTELRIGQWGHTNGLLCDERALHARPLAPRLFHQNVLTGYQLSMQQHQGAILLQDVDRTRSHVSDLRGDIACSFDMQITPELAWGADALRSTGTWLTRFQIFEPGWQIISSFARATGTLQDWHGRVFRFNQAPIYIEKNWGSAFPSRWFWLQCNVFDEIREQAATDWLAEDQQPLALTCVGARRAFCWPGRSDQILTNETIGMIAFHWRGLLWEFAPWSCRFIRWNVQWGHWHIEAQGTRYAVTVTAETSEPGTLVLGPTRSGMDFVVRDGTHGTLRLLLRDHQRNIVILDALCYDRAAVETGGELVTDPNVTTWGDGRDAFPLPLKTLFLLGERPGRAVKV